VAGEHPNDPIKPVLPTIGAAHCKTGFFVAKMGRQATWSPALQ
jgi:hypothetical protein